MEDNIVDQMGIYEMSRWVALMEGVNFIADTCEERNIDFETVSLDPLDFRKYVESKCDGYYKRLEEEEKEKQDRQVVLQRSLASVLDEVLEHCRAGRTTDDICYRV